MRTSVPEWIKQLLSREPPCNRATNPSVRGVMEVVAKSGAPEEAGASGVRSFPWSFERCHWGESRVKPDDHRER